MGLSLVGSVVWLAGLAAALGWPALVALGVWRHHRQRLPDRGAFLVRALPLAYATAFVAHALLGDVVVDAGRRAAVTGSAVDVPLAFVAVLAADAAAVLAVLLLLVRRLVRRGLS